MFLILQKPNVKFKYNIIPLESLIIPLGWKLVAKCARSKGRQMRQIHCQCSQSMKSQKKSSFLNTYVAKNWLNFS